MNEPAEKLKILVVDDSDLILHALKNFFREYNLEVITCHDGLEGIQQAMETRPTLIILDLMMPNLDGVKMLNVIKLMKELKDIPVIVISGNTNKRNVIAAIEAGAEKVLSKPLKKELLKKSISEVLGPEFLKNAKKPEQKIDLNKEDQEFINELRQYFLNGFNSKVELMESVFRKEDMDNLRFVFHELKGTGSTIGSPELTQIGLEVEQKVDEKIKDWNYYKQRWDEVLEIVKEIKKEQVSLED
ncbi:MAG: response regulator [Melioribacteraceae bacterium]|jgi:response regulator RpfG family c-di-GMP phosphodiesterase|nr:response regulator [Melioribacteraceae bacterium]WKZ70139.1 MAG: response regulator [Melioribacteraceae bacterium]